jgi:hypothetical protein
MNVPVISRILIALCVLVLTACAKPGPGPAPMAFDELVMCSTYSNVAQAPDNVLKDREAVSTIKMLIDGGEARRLTLEQPVTIIETTKAPAFGSPCDEVILADNRRAWADAKSLDQMTNATRLPASAAQ